MTLAARLDPAPLDASPYLGERRDSRIARGVIHALVLALAGFALWAWLTPVHRVVAGAGAVEPDGLAQRIEHRDGGRVAAILVAEGDAVAAGQPLLRFDDGDLLAERRKLDARLARLDAEIARGERLLSIDLSGPAALPEELRQAIDPTLAAEIAYRRAQIAALRSDAAMARAEQGSIAARRAKAAAELAILRAQDARLSDAGRRGVIPLREVEGIQREILAAESQLRELDGADAVQEAALARAAAAEAEIVSGYRREAALALETRREERAQAVESLGQVADRLARTELAAPVAGVVQGLVLQGPGEIAPAGEPLMEIVPTGQGVFAEIEIPAERIGGVAPGQAARVKILAHDFTRFGDMDATVERVSPSSFVREDGTRVFRVQLALAGRELHAVDGGPAETRIVGPGMTVAADILSDRRSILSYLLKPLRLTADRALTEP